MKKNGNKGFVTIILLIVIAGLAYYTHLNNSAGNKKDSPENQEEVEQLLNYDFVDNYPKTVRETVKLHCRYLKGVYNKQFQEEDLGKVNTQIRELFDDELLALNTPDAQLQNMKNEMQMYEENKQKMINYSLSESSQIKYNTEEGKDYAKMKVTIVLQVGTSNVSGEEEYILRKDSQGKWKILGWQAVKQDITQNEGETK